MSRDLADDINDAWGLIQSAVYRTIETGSWRQISAAITEAVRSTDLLGDPFDRPGFWMDFIWISFPDLRRTGPAALGVVAMVATFTADAVAGNARWWTAAEAAQELHVSDSYVRRMARSGGLVARKHPTDSWRIWSPSTRRCHP